MTMVQAPDLCAPWIGTADVKAADDRFSTLTDEQIGPLLLPISEICYKLEGRDFPGVCEVTDLRPCLGPPFWPKLPHNWSEYVMWFGACGCGGEPWAGSCQCTEGIFQLDLQPYVPTSTAQVSEVRVDGTVFTDWVVYDFQYLARTDGLSWPIAQRMDLPSTELNTWAVDFTYGTPVPADAKLACALLCGEVALAKHPGVAECSLPDRIQSVTRQGITYVVADPMQYLGDGKTGIYLIDLWLSANNPGNTRAPATISYPGKAGLPGRVRT